MKLIQILLPLYDQEGNAFPEVLYADMKKELTARFGGLTAYTRSPAQGLWTDGAAQKVIRDEIVVYEVMADALDTAYWKAYKEQLRQAFSQDEMTIRSTDILLL